jgi:hypothetical protein
VGLVPSALLIGSTMPDLLGGTAFLIWQALLAPPAVALAPTGIRATLDPRLPLEPLAHLRTAGCRRHDLDGPRCADPRCVGRVHPSQRLGVARFDWLARQYGIIWVVRDRMLRTRRRIE